MPFGKIVTESVGQCELNLEVWVPNVYVALVGVDTHVFMWVLAK